MQTKTAYANLGLHSVPVAAVVFLEAIPVAGRAVAVDDVESSTGCAGGVREVGNIQPIFKF
jgi:hypothetical protein